MTLQTFLFTYGINTTTNFELKDISKELNIKTKILMKDQLKECEKPITNAIINFRTSNENGSHWVVIDNKQKVLYFASINGQTSKET